MIKVYKNTGGGQKEHISFAEYLSQYHSELPDGWLGLKNWVDRLFEGGTNYEDLAKEMQVGHFNIKAIQEAYLVLKNKNYKLDEDVLKFIAFLFGTSYFTRIGNPTIDVWLNAKDLNHPFKTIGELDFGFSFIDALEFQHGQNAIRDRLLSTLNWIGSQGGS